MRMLIGFLLGATAVLGTGVAGGWVSLADDLCPLLPAACEHLQPLLPPHLQGMATPQAPDIEAPPLTHVQEDAPDHPQPADLGVTAAPVTSEPPAQDSPAAPPAPVPDLAAVPGTTRLPLEFRSEMSAKGFARHLGGVTGADFSIEQRGPGRWAVRYAWADPREQQDIARAIALRIGDGGQG